jgi:hypothetical protein
MVIPTLPDRGTTVSVFAGFGVDLGGGFVPATTAADDMQLLGNLASAKAATPAAQVGRVRRRAPDREPGPTLAGHDRLRELPRLRPRCRLDRREAGALCNRQSQRLRPRRDARSPFMEQTSPVAAGSRNFHMLSYRDGEPMIGA